MVYRLSVLLVVALVLAMFAGQPVLAADDKTHEGKVVQAADGKLTMTMKGDDAKKHDHTVVKTATITLDGAKAKLEDLKAGHFIKVTVNDKNEATKIEARTKEK